MPFLPLLITTYLLPLTRRSSQHDAGSDRRGDKHERWGREEGVLPGCERIHSSIASIHPSIASFSFFGEREKQTNKNQVFRVRSRTN